MLRHVSVGGTGLILILLSLLAFEFQPTTSFQPAPSPATSSALHRTASTAENEAIKMDTMLFGRFKIPASHVFFKSQYSFGFVNLRPIVPGHVLISSKRVVPRLSDLNDEEYSDLWSTVRATQATLEKKYGPSAFNVAVQDGVSSGQSVPHVHVHILPRSEGDLERNDDVYDELQEWAPRHELSNEKPKLDVPEDADRKDRTTDQMAEEAASYRELM